MKPKRFSWKIKLGISFALVLCFLALVVQGSRKLTEEEEKTIQSLIDQVEQKKFEEASALFNERLTGDKAIPVESELFYELGRKIVMGFSTRNMEKGFGFLDKDQYQEALNEFRSVTARCRTNLDLLGLKAEDLDRLVEQVKQLISFYKGQLDRGRVDAIHDALETRIKQERTDPHLRDTLIQYADAKLFEIISETFLEREEPTEPAALEPQSAP